MVKDSSLEKKVDILEYIDLIVHTGNMICLNDINNKYIKMQPSSRSL